MSNGHDKHLGKHSTGERAWLRRQRDGLSQTEMARMTKVSERTYRRAETDRIPWPSTYQVMPVTDATLGELCALARRRHGLGLRNTAAALGCTHVTLLAKERRSDADLVAYWRGHGYRFPAWAEK